MGLHLSLLSLQIFMEANGQGHVQHLWVSFVDRSKITCVGCQSKRLINHTLFTHFYWGTGVESVFGPFVIFFIHKNVFTCLSRTYLIRMFSNAYLEDFNFDFFKST